MREARQMSIAAASLVNEAANKANNGLISGSDEVYASMAHQAQLVMRAGQVIASADQGNGTFDRMFYQQGVAMRGCPDSGGT